MANGTYGAFNSSNKTVVIRSQNGSGTTIINGGGNRCATLGSSPEHTDTRLIGFTLQGGNASSASVTVARNYGGGAAFGTLENCRIQNNSAAFGGGTYYGVLKDCVISGNTATSSGGGAYLSALDRCVVTGNTAADKGGGLYLCQAANTLLRGNTGYYGGGSHSGTLVNCTVLGNFDAIGGGSHSDTVKNSIVWANTQEGGITPTNYRDGTWSHSCTSPLPAGEDNIDADPQFFDSNGRLSEGSPCVETGNNRDAIGEFDLDKDGRFQSYVVNMGAYDGFKNARILHVDATHGNNANNGTSWTLAKADIQSALNSIPTYASGVIYVTNGVYGPVPSWVPRNGCASRRFRMTRRTRSLTERMRNVVQRSSPFHM